MTVNVADITSNSNAAWLIEVSELMIELEIYWPYPSVYKPLANEDKDVNLLVRIGSFLNPLEKGDFPSSTSLQNITVASNHSVVLYTAPRDVVSQTSWWSSFPKTDAVIRETAINNAYESKSNSLADLFHVVTDVSRSKSTKNNFLGQMKTQRSEIGLQLPIQLAKSTNSYNGSGLLYNSHSRESLSPHFTVKSGGKSSEDFRHNHVPHLVSFLTKNDDRRQSLMLSSDSLERRKSIENNVDHLTKRNTGTAIRNSFLKTVNRASYKDTIPEFEGGPRQTFTSKHSSSSRKFDGLPKFTQVNDEPISLGTSVDNSNYTLDKIQSSIMLLERVTKQEFKRQREMNAKLEELLNNIMTAKYMASVPGGANEHIGGNSTPQITELREDIQELSSIVHSITGSNGQAKSSSIFAKFFGSNAITKSDTMKQPTNRTLTSKKPSGKVDIDDE